MKHHVIFSNKVNLLYHVRKIKKSTAHLNIKIEKFPLLAKNITARAKKKNYYKIKNSHIMHM